MRRRSGLVAAVSALVVLGLSGCDTYEVSVEREGGVDYLEASAVGANDTVLFFGFLPEFTEFQLDDEGEPLLDSDGNFVPAAAGEAWVDDFTSIVPAFLTAYPATHPLVLDEFSDDLDCYSNPIQRWDEVNSVFATTTDANDEAFCDDFLELNDLTGGLESAFFSTYGAMTADPSPVVDGVARLELPSESEGFCDINIIALKSPYTPEELDDPTENGGILDIDSTPEQLYEVINNMVGFVEAGELASTNGYFLACVDDNGSGGGAAPASTTTPKLATTGANVEWLLVAGLIAVIAGAGFLTVSRRKRPA
jgi:LPXTG-motif cell wall-anchored protein